MPFPPAAGEVGSLVDEGLVAMWLSALHARPDNSGSSMSSAIRLRPATTMPLQVTAYGITPNAPEPYIAYMASLAQMEAGRAPQPIQDWGLWWFLRALTDARTGDLAPALQAAQDKAEAFLACLGPAGQADLARAADCARQVDPAHPLAQLHR